MKRTTESSNVNLRRWERPSSTSFKVKKGQRQGS